MVQVFAFNWSKNDEIFYINGWMCIIHIKLSQNYEGGEIFIPKSTSMSLKEFINYLNYKKPLKTIGIRVEKTSWKFNIKVR